MRILFGTWMLGMAALFAASAVILCVAFIAARRKSTAFKKDALDELAAIERRDARRYAVGAAVMFVAAVVTFVIGRAQ